MGTSERDNPPPLLKKTGTTLGMLIFLALIAIVLFLVISPFFGWRTEIVLSGSMEPAIPTGSLVVASPIAPGEVQEGDIIMFSALSGQSLTTHRVIRIEEKDGGFQFFTKGDANKGGDINPVVPAQIIGTIVLTIPYLGYLFSFIRTPIGLLFLLIIPITILVLSELLSILKTKT